MLMRGCRPMIERRESLVKTCRLVSMLVALVLLGADGVRGEQAGPIQGPAAESPLARYAPRTQVSGGFRIAGSETMYPLLTRLAAEFRRRQPQVVIEVRGGGSAKALSEFLELPANISGRIVLKEERDKDVLLVASSRELLASEVKQFVSSRRYEPVAIPVAVDAVAVYVGKDNPVPGLTLGQVDAMFSASQLRSHRGEITQWGQLGTKDAWATVPIELYGRDRKSGTRVFFQEHVLAGGEFAPRIHEEPGAASVILALSRDRYGIGYSGLGLEISSVRAVPLAADEGMPFVAPSRSTVADQTYPLRRVLYLYLDRAPKAQLPAAVQEFLAFLMSQEGQEAVVKAGFFPLPPHQVEQTLVALGVAEVGVSAAP